MTFTRITQDFWTARSEVTDDCYAVVNVNNGAPDGWAAVNTDEHIIISAWETRTGAVEACESYDRNVAESIA